MMKCEVCGNHYDKPLQIEYHDVRHCFDCFECAIHALAPHCASCGSRVIGHGVESESSIFCSAHCARVFGQTEFVDRAPIPIALSPRT